MRHLKLTFLASTLFIGSTIAAVPPPIKSEMVKLEGQALYSFTPNYLMVQTEKYVYKISAYALNSETQLAIEKASLNNSKIKVSLPKNSISYVWPTQPYKTDEEKSQKYAQLRDSLVSEAKEHNGEISIRGKTAMSFSEAYFLVEAGGKIYQIRKSDVNPKQLQRIQTAGVGGQISETFSKNAIRFSWSFTPNEIQGDMPAQKPEKIQVAGNSVRIRGKVLLSYDDDLVMVQSKEAIFQLRRKGILAANDKLFENPGSPVELTAKLSAVEFVWPAGMQQLIFEGGSELYLQ